MSSTIWPSDSVLPCTTHSHCHLILVIRYWCMLPFYPNLSHCLHLNYVMLRLRFSKLMSKAFCVYVLAWVNSIYIHGIRMRFSCCAVTLQLLIAGYSHCLYHLRIIFFFVSVAKCVFFSLIFFINVCNICVNDFCDD